VRKSVIASSLIAACTVLAPGAAWADHCVNVSRGAGNAVPWETTRGRWAYISPEVGSFWVFDTPDNFQGGKGDALLENTGACNAARLKGQTGGDVTIDSLNGIWSEDCVNEAAGIGG
jgi:hypothetical protein